MLLDKLYASVSVAALCHSGYLYLYRYHGRNTFSGEHHLALSGLRRTPNAWLHQNESKLREVLNYYNLARPLVVVGQEGPAFAVN